MGNPVTFTSDFGFRDPYVAEVKGVIKACAPDAEVIDITHGIEQGNLAAASFVLMCSCQYFADGTVHLAVVDPGVGTERAILVVKTERFTFLGPDNGILHRAAHGDGIRTIQALDIKRFLGVLGRVYGQNRVVQRIITSGPSMTFHGRDLFAPLVGYVLCGYDLGEVSERVESMVTLERDEVVQGEGRIFGRVLYIDHFGNLITNIASGMVGKGDEVFVKRGGEMVSTGTPVETYSRGLPGSPIALTGSRGYLEIAVNGGNAQKLLGASCGDEVFVLKKG